MRVQVSLIIFYNSTHTILDITQCPEVQDIIMAHGERPGLAAVVETVAVPGSLVQEYPAAVGVDEVLGDRDVIPQHQHADGRGPQ